MTLIRPTFENRKRYLTSKPKFVQNICLKTLGPHYTHVPRLPNWDISKMISHHNPYSTSQPNQTASNDPGPAAEESSEQENVDGDPCDYLHSDIAEANQRAMDRMFREHDEYFERIHQWAQEPVQQQPQRQPLQPLMQHMWDLYPPREQAAPRGSEDECDKENQIM
ncbi:unnamed protein product [Caenorhabditis brenneri]